MKRLMYFAGTAGLVFSIYGGTTYASLQASSSQAARTSVRLCSSAPIGVPGDSHIVRGIFNGVELATAQWRPKFRAAGLNLLAPNELNDGKSDGSAVDPDKEASNARQCLDDGTAFAYIGTLNSSMAQVSEPILNKGSMAMISPANSNPVLTSPTQRSTYEPLTASGKLKYPTYYRVVTTDNLQGPAGALFMAQRLHVKTFYYVDDGQTYGVGLAQHMAAYNQSAHLGMKQVGQGRVNTSSASAIASTASAIASRIASTHPDAVYCGCDEPNSYPLLRAARRDGWKGAYVGGDAIYDPTWFKFVGLQQAANTTATFIGLNPAFAASSFHTAYHKMFPSFVPGPYDALSYDASNVALKAIYTAAKAGKLKAGTITQKRAAILPYIRNIHYMGANGMTSFDSNGDTRNRVLSIFQTVLSGGGQWKFVETVRNLPRSLKPTS